MLTSKQTRQVPIPHEDGEWMKLRLLSGKQLALAREIRTQTSFANLKAMGGEVFREVRDIAPADAEAAVNADPLAAYDIDTLLKFGIVGWSYSERLCQAALDDLDEVTRNWAATEIAKSHIQNEETAKNA